MAKSRAGSIIRFFGSVVFVLFISGCILKPNINIGLVAELTGKQSDLGIQLRNGIQMAVSEINASGGIHGRQINLIIVDETEFSKNIETSLQSLIDQKIVTVLGPVTSDHTMALHEATEAQKIVMLSSTAATTALSGIQDHFFRTFVSTDYLASKMAEYIHNAKKITRVSVIYDLDNLSYSEAIFNTFSATLESLGGSISAFQNFSSSESPDFETLVDELMIAQTDAVLIITSPTDAALIAQAIHLADWKPDLFGAPWTQGPALIELGGGTVEGMEAITPFDINADSAGLQGFISAYQTQNGEQPLFSAVSGYETMMFLAQALQETRGRANGLEEAILSQQDFPGLSSPISLDQFGDALRPLIIQKVVDGEFVTIMHLEPGS
jgi:branched-chain amino acid transport system substrate-binding protein